MTAEEILAKLAEAEGLYVEVGRWAISKHDEYDEEGREFAAMRYSGIGPQSVVETELFHTFPDAVAHALKDGQP